MVAQTQIFFLDAKAQQPVLAVVLPVGEPLQVGVGLAEELALHLLKLAGTEGEVARGDLVAERLADLADAEGQLAAGRALDVRKVDEDALRGLGAQVAGGGGILGHADGGLEHQVELADGGEVMLAADGADDLGVGGDELVHLVKGHGIDVHALALLTLGDELVCAVAALAGAAVQQRVREAGHVAGGHPGLGVHQDGSVQPDVVGAFLHEFLHPCLFDVVLELDTQRAVVPAVGQAAVDFAARIDEPAVFAQVHDHVKGLFTVLHYVTPSAWLAATQSVFATAPDEFGTIRLL